MIGTVVSTFVYPIKGLHSIETINRGLRVNPGVGVVGDRNLAVYRRTKNVPTSWKPKGMFWVSMNREGMATETGLTEADLDDQYRLSRDVAESTLTKRSLLSGHNQLVDTAGQWHLGDNNQPFVSFLNLASVRDLERATGITIDPRRFRMNVWVEGLEPWVELSFVDSTDAELVLSAGCTELSINSLCYRCKAIEQSPQSGHWDLELQKLIVDHLTERVSYQSKKAVMGWFTVPRRSGMIFVGDKITFRD